jgi:hypothetical protein
MGEGLIQFLGGGGTLQKVPLEGGGYGWEDNIKWICKKWLEFVQG